MEARIDRLRRILCLIRLSDRRYDFDFSILGERHFRYPSYDHGFEPIPRLKGWRFGEEGESVGMRRQRGEGGSGGGVMMEEEIGGRKRTRLLNSNEDAIRFDGGFEVSDGADGGAREERKLDGRKQEMSTVD